jgi:hypothetical protein
MAEIKVKIRRIYSTALSYLFLRSGFTIVQPTLAIRERLGIQELKEEAEVDISDRQDRQGIIIQGHRQEVELTLHPLKENFPDAIFRHPSQLPISLEKLQGKRLSWAEFLKFGKESYEVEFPYSSKLALDELRRQITPTLPGHHLLKVIDPLKVDKVEKDFNPQRQEEIAQSLKNELIYSHYYVGKPISIFHVKLDGTPIQLKGRIKEVKDPEELRIERRFKGGGTYDGLGLAKEEGDWGVMEVREEDWIVHSYYFSQEGRLKGEIYNINTPVEFYDGSLRYIDLEIDVVRYPDGKVKITDEEELKRKVEQGVISLTLAQKALHLAYRMKDTSETHY